VPEQLDHSVPAHRSPMLNTNLSEADAQFQQRMRKNLDRAADHFRLDIEGEPRPASSAAIAEFWHRTHHVEVAEQCRMRLSQ